MKATAHEIECFREFALRRIDEGASELTMDDLYEQWRLERYGEDRSAEDLLAVRESLQDFDAGERGVPFEEFDRDFRARKFGESE